MNDKTPLLPIRDLVIFPHMVMSLLVGREKSINALEVALESNKMLFLCTQKNYLIESPKQKDLYDVGVLAEVLQALKLPDGSYKVVIGAKKRAKLKKVITADNFDRVDLRALNEKTKASLEIQALMRTLVKQFEEYAKLNPKISGEKIVSINSMNSPSELADSVAAQLDIKIPEKQRILEELDALKRLKRLSAILESEIEILRVEKKILGDVKKQLDKSQKDYYLQEQLKAIEKELGYKREEKKEAEKLTKQIKNSGMSKEAKEIALREVKKLNRMSPISPESAVIRNYLDWLLRLPWQERTEDCLSIKAADKVLEADHYGLDKAKKRILEYLAVKKHTKDVKSQILCFVGPPGVGKTSLAKSIARALNRNFVRVSLGGIRDEAEIKGHRRTYVGALPGRIMQSLAKAKSRKPVFLLDEIDKMSADFRGDPSSAMLEVLDPEENHSFSDHYLEVDFDLSEVMFIATSNLQDNIPHPLLDRMELIKLPGYTDYEKLKIARSFIIPKQLKKHGLSKKNIDVSDNAIKVIIKRYTLEAGVRNLEREIANLCRKVVREIVEFKKKNKLFKITTSNLYKYLGPPRYSENRKEKHNEIGVAFGLAWTQAGGDIMPVEAVALKGTGKLTLTGKLGEVMQESARAALAFIRSVSDDLKINQQFYKNRDIHVHVPEGAIPKDGPSAGITIATSIASALTNKPVNKNVAMTGEITLRGKVLAVGGLKSKILAAHRAGFKTVILPKENKKDLEEIPKDVLKKLNIKFVENIAQVFQIALMNKRRKRAADSSKKNGLWPNSYSQNRVM
jgi:ATP-dependent Lon protease